MKNLRTYAGALPEISEEPTLDEMDKAAAEFFSLIEAEHVSVDEFLAANAGQMNNHVHAWVSGFSEIYEDL